MIIIPEVWANRAAAVQVVPKYEEAPPIPSVFEKETFSAASSESSGMKSSVMLPPASVSEKVVSIDSRKMYIKFLFCSGNFISTLSGST